MAPNRLWCQNVFGGMITLDGHISIVVKDICILVAIYQPGQRAEVPGKVSPEEIHFNNKVEIKLATQKSNLYAAAVFCSLIKKLRIFSAAVAAPAYTFRHRTLMPAVI